MGIVSVDAAFWRELRIVWGGSDAISCDANIKATVATRELFFLILTSNHVEAASPDPSPGAR